MNSVVVISNVNDTWSRPIHAGGYSSCPIQPDQYNFMLFASKKKISRPFNPLRINSSTIEEVFHTKFLGVTIDSQLNWKKHCNNIINKVIKGIGILGKERRLLNDDTLTTLYYSLIYPYLTYCIEVWGNTHQTTLKKLLILQKKLLELSHIHITMLTLILCLQHWKSYQSQSCMYIFSSTIYVQIPSQFITRYILRHVFY